MKIDYKKIDELIPIISPEKINKIDSYFNTVKCLNKEQHQLWRIIKKSVPIIYKRFTTEIHKTLDLEEQIAWIALDVVVKKQLCNEIIANLIIEK